MTTAATIAGLWAALVDGLDGVLGHVRPGDRCARGVCEVTTGTGPLRRWRSAAQVADVAARLARAARLSPTIRRVAAEATYPAPLTDPRAVSQGVLSFVAESIRYAPDPVRAELVQPPADVLASGIGDCEDSSALIAALVGSLGVPARLVVVGYDPTVNGYDHVYAEVEIAPGVWLAADATLPQTEGGTPQLGRQVQANGPRFTVPLFD